MPKFKIEASSKYKPEETFQRIKTLLETDKDLRKLDTYTCNFNPTAFSGSAKGNKFEADMKVTSVGEGAQVQIDVSLPLMLTPIKGLVQTTLQKKLDTILA